MLVHCYSSILSSVGEFYSSWLEKPLATLIKYLLNKPRNELVRGDFSLDEIVVPFILVSFTQACGHIHLHPHFSFAYCLFCSEFPTAQSLHSIHRDLLGDLSLATSPNMNFISLSEVFLKARDSLLIYGEYCGHVQRAQSLVLELMRNDVEKRTQIEVIDLIRSLRMCTWW